MPGATIQRVRRQVNGYLNPGSVAIPFDDTIPQIGEGNALPGFNFSITPASAANLLCFRGQIFLAGSAGTDAMVTIFKDGAPDAVMVFPQYQVDGSFAHFTIDFDRQAGGIAAQAYTVREGSAGATTNWLNGNTTGRKFGGILNSVVECSEIQA